MSSYLSKLDAFTQAHPSMAYFYATVAYTFHALMQVTFKYITAPMHPFQTMFYRAIPLLIFNTALLYAFNESPYIKQPRTFGLMMRRLVFSGTFSLLSLYCVKYLPVSTVSSLVNTSPIFIFFIESVYYRKPIHKINLILTCLSFIGVILILQPTFLFDSISQTPQQKANFLKFSGIALFCAFCFAMHNLLVHGVSGQLSNTVNIHYSFLAQVVLACLYCCSFPEPIQYDMIDSTYFVVFGVSLVFATFWQRCFFVAVSLTKPSNTMPFGYVNVIVGFIIDVLYFDVSYNALSIIGMTLAGVGLLMKLLVERAGLKTESNLIKLSRA